MSKQVICLPKLKKNKNYYLWKEPLNSDNHQFYQYQQNEWSLFILTEITEYKKKTITYNVGNPGPSLGKAQKSGGIMYCFVNSLYGYKTFKYNFCFYENTGVYKLHS